MALFLTVVLSIWAGLHGYVFWRLGSIPWISNLLSKRTLWLIALALWSSFIIARLLDGRNVRWMALPLEHLAATWVGLLFLLFASFVALDVVTLGGVLFKSHTDILRTGAGLVAVVLAFGALIQAARPPVIRDYTVTLPGLPKEREGLTIVGLSDLHLGNLIGEGWLRRLATRVEQLQPDMLVIVGDLVDGNAKRVETMVPLLRRLRAPLGVFAVTGNHEFYAGIDRSVSVLESAGFTVLRDRWHEVLPGLIVAGVDDLTARPRSGSSAEPMERALSDRPWGATILLSHSPLEVNTAAQMGARLMLSGHTHNGQIWPFKYLVRLRYDYLGGLYRVGDLNLIVCRGTGTWGPRMRLWRPSELVRIRLQSAR